MRSKIAMSLLLIFLFSVLIGCSTKSKDIVTYPLPADFVMLKSGETFTPQKAGAYCSNEYLAEVLRIKMEQAKK